MTGIAKEIKPVKEDCDGEIRNTSTLKRIIYR